MFEMSASSFSPRIRISVSAATSKGSRRRLSGWLDVGNTGTAGIAALLRSERERIERFATIEETSVLILSIGANAV